MYEAFVNFECFKLHITSAGLCLLDNLIFVVRSR